MLTSSWRIAVKSNCHKLKLIDIELTTGEAQNTDGLFLSGEITRPYPPRVTELTDIAVTDQNISSYIFTFHILLQSFTILKALNQYDDADKMFYYISNLRQLSYHMKV